MNMRSVVRMRSTHVTEQYLAGKRRECRSYAAQVSQWELEQYLVAY